MQIKNFNQTTPSTHKTPFAADYSIRIGNYFEPNLIMKGRKTGPGWRTLVQMRCENMPNLKFSYPFGET
jgi:hypothetical protein